MVLGLPVDRTAAIAVAVCVAATATGAAADDQVLFEENTQNRLMEALTLFEYICGSRYFENTAIILFLNKNDIFAGEWWSSFIIIMIMMMPS